MKNKNIIKIFYRLFFFAAIFFAMFVLLQMGESFLAAGAAGIVILIAGYLYLSQKEKEKQEEKDQREQERQEFYKKLEELLNVQKAVYTAIKRGTEKMEKQFSQKQDGVDVLEKLTQMQEQIIVENQQLAEIQVNALKTVAKYNKENARQLAAAMNENADKLGMNFQSSMEQMQQEMSDIEKRYKEMSEVMLTNTVTLSDRVGELADKVEKAAFSKNELNAQKDKAAAMEQITEVADALDIEQTAEKNYFKEMQEEPEPLPAPAMPVIDDPNRAMSPDEIAALIASMGN